jgi:hydroxyacylglutathione hydrolase
VKFAKVQIRYVFETHRNQDYVVGSLELAGETGAGIYHGSWPRFNYGKIVEDEQKFPIGALELKAIYTPGHTLGCVSYVVTDLESGNAPVLAFTGDTLFVDDVGRTDFGGPEKRREWSERLYESIFQKLLPLGDQVIVLPAHGGGSLCGSNIADREVTTIGLERRMNPVLQLSRQKFIEFKVNEHHEYPPYFRMMEKLNVEGARPFGHGPSLRALNPSEFKNEISQGALVVDTRAPPAFGAGHIEGSYNAAMAMLGLVGWALPYDKPLILILPHQKSLDYVARNLARIGYDNLRGYLTPSIVSWYKSALPTQQLEMITAPDLKERLCHNDWIVLDVRSRDEWIRGHVKDSLNIYFGQLEKRLEELPTGRRLAVMCESGIRASFACSILLRAGIRKICNVLGGMAAWKNAKYPIDKTS